MFRIFEEKYYRYDGSIIFLDDKTSKTHSVEYNFCFINRFCYMDRIVLFELFTKILNTKMMLFKCFEKYLLKSMSNMYYHGILLRNDERCERLSISDFSEDESGIIHSSVSKEREKLFLAISSVRSILTPAVIVSHLDWNSLLACSFVLLLVLIGMMTISSVVVAMMITIWSKIYLLYIQKDIFCKRK